MKLLAIDTETELFPPLGTPKVNMRNARAPLVCTSLFNAETGAGYVYEQHEQDLLLDRLEDAYLGGFYLAFHNAAYDVGVLCEYADERVRDIVKKFLVERRIVDTRVMYFLRYPDPPSRVCSLAFLSERFLKTKLDKGAVRTSFQRGQRLSREQREYALQDAIVTGKLAKLFCSRAYGSIRQNYNIQVMVATERVAPHVNPDVIFSCAAAWKAFHLTAVGMELDIPNLERHHQRLSATVEGLGRAMHNRGLADYVRPPGVTETPEPGLDPREYSRKWEYDHAKGRLVRVRKGAVESVECRLKKNLRLVQALAREVEDERSLRIPRSEKTGVISLKRDDWMDHIGSLPEDLELFFDFEKQSKYLSTFTKPLVESGARRVHSDYYIPGAATGRWSCTKPNLQQVWKGIRDIYRAKEGHVLVAADYPTLELYTLAQTMSGMGIRGPLLETLNAHEDIHTKTAETVFGDASLRQGAKACNFGLPGGMGAKRFGAHAKTIGLEWEPEEARSIRTRWLNTYYDVKQYLRGFDVTPWYFYRGPNDWESKRQWLVDDLGFDDYEVENDEVTSFDILRKVNDGRHYTVQLASGRVIPDRTYTMAANSFFQGLGADIITLAFVDLCKRLEDHPQIRVVAVVHDSIVLEAPDNEDDTMLADGLLQITMSHALKTFCPALEVPEIDVEVSERWS